MADQDPWLSERLAASVLVVKAEQQVEAAVRAAIAAWLDRVRDLVLGESSTLTAAGPPNMGGFSEADPAWLDAVRALLLPTLGELFGERFLAIARTAVISDQPYRERHLDQVFSRLKLFPAELFEEIRPEIAEALSEGEGVDQIRDRIAARLNFDQTRGAKGEQALSRRLRAGISHVERELDRDDLPDADRKRLRAERSKLYTALHTAEQGWQWKARRIARTEVMGAINGGSHAGAVARAEILEETLHKQWLSTDDERRRPTHKLAEGQIRPLLDPFDVGAATLQFPGDPTGLAGEIINCRCTTLYLDDEEVAAIEAEGGNLDIRRAQPQEEAGRGRSSIDEPGPPADVLPDDLTAVSDEDLATAAAAAFASGDDAVAERVIAELDRRDQLDAGALQAADDAVAEAAAAPDPQAAVQATDDGWNSLGEAWGDDQPAPWTHDGPDPEPISEGPGYRYDDATDEVHEDPDVPGGWVLAEDPHTGARSFYEATGVEKPARLSSAAAKAAREAYNDWVELQYMQADETTRGNLLSKAGIAAGVHPRELFSGTAKRARKYASEELLRFWQDSPRMAQVEYLFQATGDDKYRAAALKAKENNAKELVSFSIVDVLVAAAKKRRKRKRAYSRLELVRAYWQGRDAAADDQSIDACPYSPASYGVAALLWVRGFNDNRPDAVTAGGDMTEPAPDALPNGWRGHIALLDGPTGDGRILATPPDGIRLRQPPRPVMYQRVTAPGHDGSVVAGRIDRVWIEGDRLWGEGPFNLDSEDGRAAAQSLRDGMSNGVSADPDDLTWTEKFVDGNGNDVDVDSMDEEKLWERLDSGDIKPLMVMSDWRLMGATMVAFPAFDEARLEALYDYAPADEPQPGGPVDAMAAAGTLQVDDAISPTALKPAPAEHFANPGLTKFTPLTVTDDGRVYGHTSPWEVCHIGYGDTCTVAPKSHTDYAHFHLGEIITTEGRLPVGKITLGGGHADERLGYRAATEHYDDASTAVAAVRAGEDEHGIWVAGRLLSKVTAEQLELLMLCPPSGDWRRIGGHLEMVAVHSVNVPGFPVVRTMAASAGGVQISLVAAGARTIRRAHHDRTRRTLPGTGLDYRRLAAELAREQREYAARQQHVHRMAVRLGRDPQSRAQAAAARIGLP